MTQEHGRSGASAPSGHSVSDPSPDGLGHPASFPNAVEFYIVDVRQEWSGRPYLSLWRPRNAGYAYPLPWAGRYDHETVNHKAAYYYVKRYGCVRALDRFPVPCEVVERLAVAPESGIIDGDCGPVLRNDAATRRALRKARYNPASAGEAGTATTPQSGVVHEHAVPKADAHE